MFWFLAVERCETTPWTRGRHSESRRFSSWWLAKRSRGTRSSICYRNPMYTNSTSQARNDFLFSTHSFTQQIFIEHQFCMRCCEAKLEMNFESSLLQINPVQFGKDGWGSPEMRVTIKPKTCSLPSRSPKSGWRDKTKTQGVIIYLRY